MKRRRIRKEFITALFTILALLILPASTARADMGPKPEILVKVVNPPQGEYYLDLLTLDNNSYKQLDLTSYDPVKINLLENYSEEGWKPGLVMGTPAPMWGDLIGEKTKGEMWHRFGYMGVPDEFKLIIITPENKIVVSELINRKALKTIVTYDYQANSVSIEIPTIAYIKQFMGTLIATLLVEGIFMLVFEFSLRKNWISFLLINLFTQAALTITVGVLFIKEGIFTASIVFFPVEIIIIIIESILFAVFLKEHSKKRRVGYAITANVLSAVIGLVIMLFSYV